MRRLERTNVASDLTESFVSLCPGEFGGLTVPVRALRLLWDLEARHFNLSHAGDRLLVEPGDAPHSRRLRSHQTVEAAPARAARLPGWLEMLTSLDEEVAAVWAEHRVELLAESHTAGFEPFGDPLRT